MPSPDSVQAARALARVSRVLERSSDTLSLADYRILSTIVEGEARASRLAARLALGKPAVSASVDSLCRRGLLRKAQVEDDQRATALSLTPAGAELFEEVEASMAARLELLADLTPDARGVLGSITQLGAAIETYVAERGVRL